MLHVYCNDFNDRDDVYVDDQKCEMMFMSMTRSAPDIFRSMYDSDTSE
jgi:hypothetical protein